MKLRYIPLQTLRSRTPSRLRRPEQAACKPDDTEAERVCSIRWAEDGTEAADTEAAAAYNAAEAADTVAADTGTAYTAAAACTVAAEEADTEDMN